MSDNYPIAHYDPETEQVAIQHVHSLIADLPLEYRLAMSGAFEYLMAIWTDKDKILKFLHESASQRHLDMKYLQFDLAATRQERDEYRQEQDNE